MVASLVDVASKRDLLSDAEQAADSGRLSDARSMCQQHLWQHGPTASGFCLMGVIHQAAGELSDAEKSFQKALYLDPAHKDSLWHLTLLAEQRGDQLAVETLRRRLARVVSAGDQP
ncbi:MAG: chemotaxis protein methyltransferase WspC [Planctomycetota bacterium]|nr:MAG: chemotaxis protein methyltransferase WspC [Planctomycetota bacterium]